MPPIPGVTIEEICDAFIDAYDQDELARVFRFKMGEKLGKEVKPGPFSNVVFDLVMWAEKRGRLTELIRAGYQGNQTNSSMAALYAKYGMATDVSLHQGGTAADVARQTNIIKETATGLQRTLVARLPQLNFLVWRTKMTQIEGQVCRIDFDGNPVGTGFLVGPDAVLTNYHVLESLLNGQIDRSKVTCRFDYKVLADHSRVEGVIVHLHETDWKLDFSPYSPAENTKQPDNPLPTPDQLDYALVRLNRRVGEETFSPQGGAEVQTRGWLTLPTGPLAFTKDMALMIAQYPDGNPLKLAVDTDSVIGETENRLRVRYRTNTEHGSSGSPVFDLNWSLVALHHLGDPASDLPPTYNQGVPLDLIRTRILKTPAAAAALG